MIDQDISSLKSLCDRAWKKAEIIQKQEEETRKLWIEFTLEFSKSLDAVRRWFVSDQEFGTWLNENGYGEDRLPRGERSALLNIALHLELTRVVLEQTKRQSWRLIWFNEIQPLLKEKQNDWMESTTRVPRTGSTRV